MLSNNHTLSFYGTFVVKALICVKFLSQKIKSLAFDRPVSFKSSFNLPTFIKLKTITREGKYDQFTSISPQWRTSKFDILFVNKHSAFLFAQHNKTKILVFSAFYVHDVCVSDFSFSNLKVLPLGSATISICADNICTEKICRPRRIDWVFHSFNIYSSQKNLHFLCSQRIRYYRNFYDATICLGGNGLQLSKRWIRFIELIRRSEKKNDQIKTQLHYILRMR